MKLAWAFLLVVMVPASFTRAEAVSAVSAEATLDWTGFTFTTAGTLSATLIDQTSTLSFPLTETTPTTPTGAATAAASVTNGFLSAVAGALTTSDGGPNGVLPNVGQAEAFVLRNFFFYGTGSGALVIRLPYHLQITSTEAGSRDITNGSASVSLFTGPGVGSNSDWFAQDSISLSGAGTISRDGVLTASRLLSNPIFGPLVSFDVDAKARASAAVPEVGSLVLGSVGLLLIGAREVCWRLRL